MTCKRCKELERQNKKLIEENAAVAIAKYVDIPDTVSKKMVVILGKRIKELEAQLSLCQAVAREKNILDAKKIGKMAIRMHYKEIERRGMARVFEELKTFKYPNGACGLCGKCNKKFEELKKRMLGDKP